MPSIPRKSTIGNLTLWEKQEVARIEKLSDRDVLRELRDIMCGRNYSWGKISCHLQDLLNRGLLTIEHFESGNIPYEWNVLCDERITWNLYGKPSFRSFKFNRTCLINLKIIPTQAGMGPEGRKFATINLDDNSTMVNLSIDEAEKSGGEEQEFKADVKRNPGYFYADGPEFRLEYVHDRVED